MLAVGVSMLDVPVPSARPTIICLLGMHRSGTSVVARLLNLLGVYLGPPEHLLRPGADNPRGYWENQRLFHVNKRILARFGGDWREPPSFPPGWQCAPGLEDLRQSASAIVAEEFGNAPVWGWKDPRTCLTLPFWQDLLPPMRYVICVRHPQSVARSLERRNRGFPPERGVYLWAAYLKAALACTEGEPRIIVSYEEIMNDWRPGVQALAAFLGEPWRAEEEDLQDAVGSFISPDLRHHLPAADWLEEGRPEAEKAFRLAQETYESLREHGARSTEGLVQKLGVALEILATEVRRLKGTRSKKVYPTRVDQRGARDADPGVRDVHPVGPGSV